MVSKIQKMNLTNKFPNFYLDLRKKMSTSTFSTETYGGFRIDFLNDLTGDRSWERFWNNDFFLIFMIFRVYIAMDIQKTIIYKEIVF